MLSTHTHTQLLAQEPKWGIHNSIVDYSNSTTSTLPTNPNPDYTQNAVWDVNGDLVIYEADGVIYNMNGVVILDMNIEALSLYNVQSAHVGFTEFIFVPVPEECDQYYGITTYTNGTHWDPSYKTDVVWCKIDLNLNNGLGDAIVLPLSGLKVAKESISCATRDIKDKKKPFFNMHIEVTNKLSNGNRYLFASNSSCVAVLNLTASSISFIDGYQTGGVFPENLRSENGGF